MATDKQNPVMERTPEDYLDAMCHKDYCGDELGGYAAARAAWAADRAELARLRAQVAERGNTGEWTGRKCAECEGLGCGNDNQTCAACAGAGEEWLSWREQAAQLRADLAALVPLADWHLNASPETLPTHDQHQAARAALARVEARNA
jgi:hypothetical protein